MQKKDAAPPPTDPAYQEAAAAADTAISFALNALAEGKDEVTLSAIVSGAVWAVVRFGINRIIRQHGIATVRGALTLFLPVVNKAAEGVVATPPASNDV